MLDNLEEFNFIKLYLPNNHKGYILITTRSQALGHFAKSIKLDKMDILTGSLFLLRRATLLQENDPLDLASENHKSNAQEIAKEMDGLPLALEQAGAFIEQTRCSLDKYLTAYKDVRNTANMLKNDGQDTHDHISVFSTFKLALDKVKEKNLTAAKLLEACSFLDPDLIPIEIFTQAGNLLGDELSTLKSNNYEFDKCLKLLINYSLIERDSNNNSLSIHRLVQNVIRESIYNGTKQHWTEKLIKALGILCPRETTNPANWSTYRRLLPTVLALSELSNISGFVSPEVATLFNQFGIYSDTQAIYSQSLYFFQQALSIRKQHFGHNHPEVANILHNIAGVYQSQGKYDKALIFSNQALKISKQHFGNNHPDVASSIVGIATLYDSQGKHDEALNFYQQALEIYKHHFGGNHINVAKTLHNIATTYYYQSKHDKALDFYQQALPIKKQHLGYNHPETAKTLIGIANIHYSQGKYDEALDFYQQALEIYKTHFGDKHPDVAMALNNIAMVYKSQNKYIDASNFFHQALSTRKQSLGNYHPYVARTLENLGNLSQAMTKETEAMEYYKEALAIYDKTFPSGHPWIADLLDTYSKLSLKLNKNDEAKVLQNRLHRLNATNLSD